MCKTEDFIELGNILLTIADWLWRPEGFADPYHCSMITEHPDKIPQNARENYQKLWETVRTAEDICLSLPETHLVVESQKILASMMGGLSNWPLLFIGKNVSDADKKNVVEIAQRLSSDFRMSLLDIGGRLIAHGKRNVLKDGVSHTASSVQTDTNRQSQNFQKNQTRHAWDSDTATIAEKYKRRLKREHQLTLKDFCWEEAEKRHVPFSTLYKKMTSHRDKWDPDGKFGRRSSRHK